MGTMEAGGQLSSGLKFREAEEVMSEGKSRWMPQLRESKSILSHLYVVSRPYNETMSTCISEGLLYPVH
jgi:hypothetical protein